MSIWASISGNDITTLDPDYEQDPEPEGWIDVAVSIFGTHARVIVGDRHGESCIALDPSGLAELHRRIVIARQRLEGDQK